MKTKNLISTLTKIFFIIFISCLFSCNNQSNGSKYDGLILKDENTGKRYILKHNALDSYFIDEQVIKISGKDTILIFE